MKIEQLKQKASLTSLPSSNVNAEENFSETNDKFSSHPLNFCCSDHVNCKLKTTADPMKRLCLSSMKGVHVTCGSPNPDFEKGK